jgi:hypothetical protein
MKTIGSPSTFAAKSGAFWAPDRGGVKFGGDFCDFYKNFFFSKK